MTSYTWDLGLVKRELKDIKELLKEDSLNNEYISDINTLKSIINFQNYCFFPTPVRYINNKQKNISTIYEYEEFNEDIINFGKMSITLDQKLTPPKRHEYIKEENILEFVHDFFQEFNPYYREIFNYHFNERNGHINFSGNRSCSFYISTFNNFFLNIEHDNTVQDYLSAIHEYAHVIADSIKPQSYYYTAPFIELLPFFSELNALDYLSKKMPVLKSDINSYLYYFTKEVINLADIINILINFYKDDNRKTYLTAAYSLRKNNSINYKSAYKILKSSLLSNYLYSIGFLTAIELYYKDDKDLATLYLNELLKINDTSSYIDELAKRDIELNRNSECFINELNKRVITK